MSWNPLDWIPWLIATVCVSGLLAAAILIWVVLFRSLGIVD